MKVGPKCYPDIGEVFYDSVARLPQLRQDVFRLSDAAAGKLARGESYAASAEDFAGETGRIEKVVGMLQGAVKGEVDAEAFVLRARGAFEAVGETAPGWLNAELIGRVLARLRQLRGQWRGTAFGDAMELHFPGGS